MNRKRITEAMKAIAGMTYQEWRLLEMQKTEREGFIHMREHAKETLDRMIANAAPDTRIRRQKMMIMQLSGSITRLNDAIFAAEQRMGIACERERAGENTGTA